MALNPARTLKLRASSELAIVVGDHLVTTNAHPDRTHVYDLTTWPLAVREVPGFFATQLSPRPDGTLLAVGRHHHANPYRLYTLDPHTLAVTPLRCEGPWHDLRHAVALGDRAIVVPNTGGGHTPFVWNDGAVTPLDLPPPTAPEEVTHDGHVLRMYRAMMDHADVFPLATSEALVLWHDRLYRVADTTVTPLATEHITWSGSPLCDGRHDALDAHGRAVTTILERFVAIDREGSIELLSPGSARVTGVSPAPDNAWLLTTREEEAHVVLSAEQSVIVLDLTAMRLAPRFPMFSPKVVHVPARNALLALHSHDAWEFDFDAVRAEKKLPFAKHAAKLDAARRSAWKRKVKAGGTPIPLDTLSMWVRGGGTVVEHPAYGVGVVTHASETRQAWTMTVTATVMFETSTRLFAYMGARWVEHPRHFA